MTSPKLRFKDFNDYWKEGTLISFSDINPKIKKLPQKFIYIDLESVDKGSLILLKNMKLTDAPSRAQRVLDKGDILFQMVRPYQQNNYYFNLDGDYVASTGYAQIRVKNELDSKFIYYALHQSSFLDNVMLRCTGTGYPAINSSELSTINLFIPNQISEQAKISSFLSIVDEKIAQLTQKHELLSQYKQGMMQKLFSQQIRFKADDGSEFEEWEKKPLVELSEKAMYGMNASAKEYDGRNKYLRITDICENSHKLKSDGFTSPNAQLEEKYKLKAGDLLFARTGASVGKSYLYTEDDGVTYFAGFLIKFSLKVDLVYPYFIFAQTLTSDFDQWVITNSMRSGQPGINAEEYSSYLFQVPCLEEQIKIANFLSAIDQKIEKVAQQIEETKHWKKGLLQQMFV